MWEGNNGSAEVDLLCDRDNSKSPLTPVAQSVDAVTEVSAESIQLPNDNRVDLSVEDVLLQPLKLRAVQIVAGCLIKSRSGPGESV